VNNLLNTILWVYYYASLIAITFISIYGIATRPNILKKIIMLSILTDTANIFAVMLGFHAGRTMPPVFPGITFNVGRIPTTNELLSFARSAVDPIPQVLVVTAIVIGLAILVFLSFLAVMLYRKYGTLDAREIEAKMKGEEYG